jgi:hypothetical protein
VQQRQRGVAFGGRGERAQRDAGAVVVGAAAELGADVGEPAGNGFFIQLAGAGFHQPAGEAGQPRLAGRGVQVAGGEVELHVENRQLMRFDEIHAGAGRGLPVFNLDAGKRQCGDAEQGKKSDEVFHGDGENGEQSMER